jgi:hypothetical protein
VGLSQRVKHVDVVALMEWAEAIGFDPQEAIERMAKLQTPEAAAVLKAKGMTPG